MVSYIKFSGLKSNGIINAFERFLKYKKHTLKIITSLDFDITDYDALKQLFDLSEKKDNCDFFVVTRKILHSKFFMLEKDDGTAKVIIGSSNLTMGGTKTNIETGVFLNLKTNQKFYLDLKSQLKEIKLSYTPINEDIVAIQKKISESKKERNNENLSDDKISRLDDLISTNRAKRKEKLKKLYDETHHNNSWVTATKFLLKSTS